MIKAIRICNVLGLFCIPFILAGCISTSSASQTALPFEVGDRVFLMGDDYEGETSFTPESLKVARGFTIVEIRNSWVKLAPFYIKELRTTTVPFWVNLAILDVWVGMLPKDSPSESMSPTNAESE